MVNGYLRIPKHQQSESLLSVLSTETHLSQDEITVQSPIQKKLRPCKTPEISICTGKLSLVLNPEVFCCYIIWTDPCLFIMSYIVSSGPFHRVMEIEADAALHELRYMNKAGFNLTKTRACGRNIIGHCAIIKVQGNVVRILQCLQLSVKMSSFTIMQSQAHTILHTLSPFWTPSTTFLKIIWDDASSHFICVIHSLFTGHPLFMALSLPAPPTHTASTGNGGH